SKWQSTKKVTVVESCFYTFAEMHDVDLPFLMDRDSADLRSALHKKAPGDLSRPWGFSFYRLSKAVLSPLGTTIISAHRPMTQFRASSGAFLQRGFIFESEPLTLAGRVGTLWPRIHAVLFAYCRLITGFVLAFAGSWLADPQASSEYSAEG